MFFDNEKIPGIYSQDFIDSVSETFGKGSYITKCAEAGDVRIGSWLNHICSWHNSKPKMTRWKAKFEGAKRLYRQWEDIAYHQGLFGLKDEKGRDLIPGPS